MVVGSPTKLNLIPSGVMPVVYINQGDAGYDKEFLVYNGDSPYNVPAGVSATIRGKKADGYGVTEAAALTESSNLVTVTITEQMVAAAGANLYELVFVDTDGLRIATINMVWAVKKDALGDAVISESDLDYATQVMNQLQSVQAFKNQLDANIEGLAAETAARIAADATLQGNIDTEASTRATQDGVLQSQIDQLVAPTGTAPSAAEIENARIGADGTTYPTLGQAIREQAGDLQSEINAVSEKIESATVTPTISGTSVNGCTATAVTSNKIEIYGTASAGRRYCFLNGQNEVKVSGSTFEKTLDAGVYDIQISATGTQTGTTVEATYSTFASGFQITSGLYSFESPVMIGILLVSQTNYGTSENPSYIEFSAKKIIGKDPVARTDASTALTRIDSTDADVDDINDLIYKYNSYDAIEIAGKKTSGTSWGIVYTYNSDGTYTIDGTATGGNSNFNIIQKNTALPECIIPGEKYLLDFNGSSVPIRIYYYDSIGYTSVDYEENTVITIPSNLTGIIVRFQIANGTVLNDVRVKYEFIHVPEWAGEGGGSGSIINNTYNITTNPTITTDTNGWLQAIDTDSADETGKTDMTGAIMSMLTDTGYCHLGEGIFYVSGNIDMPEHSTLCGCGDKTQIRLLQSVTSGYCVKIKENNTIKDVAFSGSYSNITPTIEGTRTAIRFSANYDGATDGATASQTKHCIIDNVWIRNFSGNGILCHNTSINYAKGLYASNVYIESCYKGINIDYYSEFCKFTNICIAWCYYACVNNGGNNVFTACTFHATYCGFYIDGSQPNSAHGTLNGCTFCHIGSNSGIAIQMDNVEAGFIVSNCQIWYNSVVLNNCQGVVFDGCKFGRGIGSDSATITINGGLLILFSGCIFHKDTTRPPSITITNNTKTVFNGCYGDESGSAITA